MTAEFWQRQLNIKLSAYNFHWVTGTKQGNGASTQALPGQRSTQHVLFQIVWAACLSNYSGKAIKHVDFKWPCKYYCLLVWVILKERLLIQNSLMQVNVCYYIVTPYFWRREYFWIFFVFLCFGTKPHLTSNNSYIDIRKVIKEQKRFTIWGRYFSWQVWWIFTFEKPKIVHPWAISAVEIFINASYLIIPVILICVLQLIDYRILNFWHYFSIRKIKTNS